MRLCFEPLFFLPHSALRWAYFQALSENLMDTPFVILFITIDRAGIWFPYKGDEVLWTWPWARKGQPAFISLLFSGTGEFGDVRFGSLRELDAEWRRYEWACNTPASPIVGCTFPLFAGSPNYYHRFQQALQPMVNEILARQHERAVEILMAEAADLDVTLMDGLREEADMTSIQWLTTAEDIKVGSPIALNENGEATNLRT